MVFIPRRPGIREIGLSGPVKHRLTETGIPIGKLDGAGEDIDRPLHTVKAHQLSNEGIQFPAVHGGHGLVLNEIPAVHVDIVAVAPKSRFILSGGFFQRRIVNGNGCVHYSSPHSSP
jgi:hypothetical protein